MVIDSRTSIGSIDVWVRPVILLPLSCSQEAFQVTVKSDSVLDIFKPPMTAMVVNVWNRDKGHPKTGKSFAKGKFPKGTYIFPFEFPALPEDTLVIHPDDTKRRVCFPTSWCILPILSRLLSRTWRAYRCLVRSLLLISSRD
jgi:hypothetical protein